MSVKAILFDLGNTLWHIPSPPPVQEIRNATVRRIFGLLRTWGIEPEGEQRFLGRDIRLTVGSVEKQAYETDCVSPDYVEIVRSVAADKGLDLTRQQADELWHAWNLPGSFFGRRLFDDTIEMLDDLRDRGYRLACVTNRAFDGPQFHAELGELGLTGYFDVLSVSCDVGYMKPHPEIFHHALQELGVAGDDAVMVGDSLRADVAGGQALGMVGVWRRHDAIEEEVQGVEPDHVIHHLRELPALPPFANGS
jgi:putative hydrolase of the HAD superfamily